ncbi:hypothetical protein EPUS_05312 [Endocarpon pusillum Z07020]|uniref:Uncharacterized protein n=1 Tax=Endocarpon pusillum (strain Z07020 / HMAS-L-300199) TaxID=1263415 RepID=U1HLV7_ENDPU|nr:uncharacterized protein EPUS_05312 [Endocarpon pusillum Z07020]ERF71260.1 hypothetical protein EPUS_05312 [Endocarpon pusillum Z07020]
MTNRPVSRPRPSDVAGDGNGSHGGLQDQSNSVWKDVFPMIPAAARLVRPHVQPSYPTRAACEEDVLVKLVEQNYSWPPVEKTRPERVQRFLKRCIFNYLFTQSTSDNTVTMTEQTTVITGKKSTSTNIHQKHPSSALSTAKTPATLSSAQTPSTPATVRVLASPSTAKPLATSMTSRMSRREMQVLGVMDSLDNEQEIALAMCETWTVWPAIPLTRSSEWSPSPTGRSMIGSIAKSWLHILSKSPATS